MRAFTVFATLAFAAVSYARPVNVDGTALNAAGAEAAAPVPVPVKPVAGVDASPVGTAQLTTRCDCDNVPDILQDVITQLQPLAAQLYSITPDNCTLAIVEPILQDVINVLTTAIADVKVIAGNPVASLLKTVNNVLSLTDVINLLSTLIAIVFGAVSALLNIVNGLADSDAICKLLAEVLTLVGQLLQLLTGILGGLLSLLLPLLTPVVSVISQLGVTQAFSGLGLPL